MNIVFQLNAGRTLTLETALPPNSTPRRFPSFLLLTLLLYFLFHLLPSPMHPTGVSSCFFPGILAIFILLSSNNNKVGDDMQLYIFLNNPVTE